MSHHEDTQIPYRDDIERAVDEDAASCLLAAMEMAVLLIEDGLNHQAFGTTDMLAAAMEVLPHLERCRVLASDKLRSLPPSRAEVAALRRHSIRLVTESGVPLHDTEDGDAR